MAESLDTVAVIAGGLTTLGVLLDWGVAPETKQRLQTKLEGLLYRFRYTTLRTFGREEIEFSMRVFNLLGQKFFSWKRLTFVLIVYATLVLSLISVLRVQLMHRAVPNEPLVAISLLTSAVIFSFSVSFTIWLSRMTLRVPVATSLLGTSLLLVIHVALFFIWRPVVFSIFAYATNIASGIWYGQLDYFLRTIPGPFPEATWTSDSFDFVFSALTAPWEVNKDKWMVTIDITDIVTGVIANALRIGLLLLFVAGNVYVQIVRPALIWFWTALTRSPALFSPPLSALAAVILALDKRDAIIGALTRPFQ